MTVYDCLSLLVLVMTTPIQMLYSTPTISRSSHSASAVLSMLITMSSITTLLLITTTLLSTTSPTSFFFVNAFGESPMGNMEPSDVALPSIQEFDERIRKFNSWIHGDYLLSETTVPSSSSSHDENNNSSSSSYQVFNSDDQQQELNNKKRNLSEILKTTQEQNETSKHQKRYSRTFTDSDDFVVPFEIRRVSKDAAAINSNNNNNKRSSSSSSLSKYLPNQDPSNSDYLIKVFATKDIKADFAELRVLAKHVLSFHTVCPKTAKRLIEKSASSSSSSSSANKNISDRQSEEREWLKQEEKDSEVESFCLLAEYLHEKLSSQPSSNHQNSASCFQGVLVGSAEGGKNSNQNDQQTSSSSSPPIPLPFNVEDFEISMMSLFLVYSRWGSGYESSNTSSFFKPMIDLFPRVPASPICTFTDSDLSILTPSLRREIKSEREFIEEQWKEGIFDSIFFDSSSSSSTTTNSNPYLSSFEKRRSEKMENLFHKLFPQDALTLPRFFWAQCTLKSKLSKCFDAGQPCVFPILDLAGYRTELSVYSPRHLAKPNEWRGYASQLAYLQEQQVLVPVHQQQNDDIQDSSSSSENINNNDNNDEQTSSTSPSSKKKKSKKLKKRNRNKNKNQNLQQIQENNNGDATGDDSVPKKLVTRKRIITRTSLVDSVTRDDNNNQLYAVLRFSYALSKGQELTLDRERRAMPFMRRGIIDHNNRARCVTVNLPTLSMKEKMDSYLKKIQDSSSSSATQQQQQQQQVESPRKLFKEDPSDAYIASLYNPCLGFVFDKSDLHPQIEAKLNRILSLQQQQQQQQSNQEQEQEDQLSPSSSVNLLQKQAEKFNQQPYTCIHLSQDSVLNFVTMVEGLGIFEDNCTIESLESEIPIESTPETQLRSVALAGKLIRAQLERISTALSKVEETYISTSNQLKKTLNKKTKKTKSEMLKKSLQEEKQEQEEQRDVSKETEIVQEESSSSNNMNKRSSSSKKNNKKKNKKSSSLSVPSSYKEYMKQQRKKSLENFVASDDEINNNEDNDDDEIENSSPKYIKASLEELSSCSPESPTKCKILSDPFPRHLTLIQDYLQNEHAGLVQIYETLTQMRDYLRKELESKDYLKN